MDWPDSKDYATALQNPRVAFREDRLKQGWVERGKNKLLRPRSGQFADVYREFVPAGDRLDEVAIRLFRYKGDNARRDRYQITSRYLREHPVKGLVPFVYHEEGIRVAVEGESGRLFPMVTMEWINGSRFDQWVETCCQDHADQRLRNGAQAWRALVECLVKNEIIHGDLQHENVIVDDAGQFILVDYDCLTVPVPELLGKPLPESGKSHYQAMNRGIQNHAVPGLDNFSSLVIYVTLLALAADQDLRAEMRNRPSKDYLLLCCQDFERGFESPMFQKLKGSSDDEVRWISAHLPSYYAEDLLKIPSLPDVIKAAELSGALDAAIEKQDDNEVIRVTQHRLFTRLLAKDTAADSNKMAAIDGAKIRGRPALFLVESICRLKVTPGGETEQQQFLEAFDARLVRRFQVFFDESRDELRDLTGKLIVTSANLGFAPNAQSWLLDESKEGLFRASWRWPDPRYGEECVLAACERRPEPGEFPWQLADFQARLGVKEGNWDNSRVNVGLARRVLRASYEAEAQRHQGHAVHSEVRYRDWYVAVWFLIDIGFTVVPSNPLVLGQLSVGGWYASFRHAVRRRVLPPRVVASKTRGQLPGAGRSTPAS